jgi:hypothetical protein
MTFAALAFDEMNDKTALRIAWHDRSSQVSTRHQVPISPRTQPTSMTVATIAVHSHYRRDIMAEAHRRRRRWDEEHRLKVQLESKLYLTRGALKDGGIARACNSARSGKADARIRIVELRGV